MPGLNRGKLKKIQKRANFILSNSRRDIFLSGNYTYNPIDYTIFTGF